MNKKHQPQTVARSGFTLIELLTVISIIAILTALILPAIFGAMRRARNAQVTAEISRLTTAIEAFTQEHNGVAPWSFIQLSESGTTWPKVSRTRIRRLWPQFNFTLANDFNGDGDTNDDITLNASECLVFFLGGMQANGALSGFSKNPINPFVRGGDSRTVPFEFDPDRLKVNPANGMLGYVDPLPGQETTYLYVSSNNGQGYSKSNGALNYYLQSDGKTPWKKDSFQIISPGDDGEFGFNPAPNPFDSSGGASDSRPKYADDEDVPQEQQDNITNFATGTLG